MVKRENQRNASVLGCERGKDHYVANPFTFTSVKVQARGSSSRRYRTLFAPPKLDSRYPDAHKYYVSVNIERVALNGLDHFEYNEDTTSHDIFLDFCLQQKKPPTSAAGLCDVPFWHLA
jgi:hypothetical protein